MGCGVSRGGVVWRWEGVWRGGVACGVMVVRGSGQGR